MNSSLVQKGVKRDHAEDDHSCAQAVQDRLVSFVASLVSNKVSRPDFKFLCEMVGGILRCGDLIIRHIALALNETSKAAGTVENRLSAHLQHPVLCGQVNEWLMNRADKRIQVYTPIAIDLTDTQRRYADNTPGVQGNYDGSTGRPGKGYTHLCATAVLGNARKPEFLPLYQDTYGIEEETRLMGDDARNVDSEFAHYQQCIAFLSQHLGGPVGIDVLDRAADDQKYFGCELHYRRWFLIRICGRRRRVGWNDRNLFPVDLLDHFSWHSIRCFVYDKKKKTRVRRRRRIGWLTVTVSVQYPDGRQENRELTLLAVRVGKNRHMFLLTNFTVDDGDDPVAFAKMLYQAYLLRWDIESCFNLIKNRIDVEKIFARTYRSAKNLFALAWLALAFILDSLKPALHLTRHLLSIPARFFRRAIPACHAFPLFTSLKWLWTRFPVSCSFH